MTITAHKNLTGVDLHEPKGVAAATANQVYRADGAGSGSWQTLTIPTGVFRVNTVYFTSTGTWTKPSNLFKIKVHVVGEGASNVTSGGTSSFGAHCSATGGVFTGAGGTSSGGDANFSGLSGATFAPSYASSPWIQKGYGTGGGGSAGYTYKDIPTASLAATVAVTVPVTVGASNNAFVLVEEFITT